MTMLIAAFRNFAKATKNYLPLTDIEVLFLDCPARIVKIKHSHYKPMGPRVFWEVKGSRFHDIGT
jgi:hypothetical protein